MEEKEVKETKLTAEEAKVLGEDESKDLLEDLRLEQQEQM